MGKAFPLVELDLRELPPQREGSIKINGVAINNVLSIDVGATKDDITEITIKMIGQVKGEVRGHVNVVEEHIHEATPTPKPKP